jgi:hypothetical protein
MALPAPASRPPLSRAGGKEPRGSKRPKGNTRPITDYLRDRGRGQAAASAAQAAASAPEPDVAEMRALLAEAALRRAGAVLPSDTEGAASAGRGPPAPGSAPPAGVGASPVATTEAQPGSSGRGAQVVCPVCNHAWPVGQLGNATLNAHIDACLLSWGAGGVSPGTTS